MTLREVREYIAGLGIAENEHVYIGRMDGKQQKSIGVYSRSGENAPHIPLGGRQNATYDTKRVSLLIHWTRNKEETEKVASDLFQKLLKQEGFQVGDTNILFLQVKMSEPQDISSDQDGVYEYVIWVDFIYELRGGKADE